MKWSLMGGGRLREVVAMRELTVCMYVCVIGGYCKINVLFSVMILVTCRLSSITSSTLVTWATVMEMTLLVSTSIFKTVF